jgi:hypothetical protein
VQDLALGDDPSAEPAHHSDGDRRPAGEPERRPDGDSLLPDAKVLGRAEHGWFPGHRAAVAVVDDDHGDIGRRVVAHHVTGEAGPVGQDDRDAVGLGDDVGVREDGPVVADDDARARRPRGPVEGRLDAHDRRAHGLGDADHPFGIGRTGGEGVGHRHPLGDPLGHVVAEASDQGDHRQGQGGTGQARG